MEQDALLLSSAEERGTSLRSHMLAIRAHLEAFYILLAHLGSAGVQMLNKKMLAGL